MCAAVFSLLSLSQLGQIVIAVLSLPTLYYLVKYANETIMLRRAAEQQLSVSMDSLEIQRAPFVFFDIPRGGPLRADDWEGILIINGGEGIALNVRYRVKGTGTWRSEPYLPKGESRRIFHEVGDVLSDALRNRLAEAVLEVECASMTGRRYTTLTEIHADGNNLTFHSIVRLSAAEKVAASGPVG
jgi:hypothetical protein